MKRIAKKVGAVVMSLAVAVSGITIGETKTKSVKAADNWNLVWSDEFNGTSLDTSVWSYEIGNRNGGWGNGEIEYYTNRTDNVRVADGSLQIIAKKKIMVDRNIHQVELFQRAGNILNMEKWKPE